MNIKQGFFITGTDTNIGKTHVSLGILEYFNAKGAKTIGIKPIASGCERTDQGLRNTDALLLQQHASEKRDYQEISPFNFAEPIAPHIAAANINSPLSVNPIILACQPSMSQAADVIVVEGVGGWLVPLNDQETCADLAKAFGWPVILVVGMRLGCINHALLTAKQILDSSQTLAGWVANVIDPEIMYLEENIRSLKQRIPAPLLGIVPFQSTPDPKITAACLSFTIDLN